MNKIEYNQKGGYMKQEYMVIGLGAMGLGIATNLLKKGFNPIGIDISEERCEKFRQLNGNSSTVLVDYITNVDTVFCVVISDKQIKQIFTESILSSMSLNRYATSKNLFMLFRNIH